MSMPCPSSRAVATGSPTSRRHCEQVVAAVRCLRQRPRPVPIRGGVFNRSASRCSPSSEVCSATHPAMFGRSGRDGLRSASPRSTFDSPPVVVASRNHASDPRTAARSANSTPTPPWTGMPTAPSDTCTGASNELTRVRTATSLVSNPSAIADLTMSTVASTASAPGSITIPAVVDAARMTFDTLRVLCCSSVAAAATTSTGHR